MIANFIPPSVQRREDKLKLQTTGICRRRRKDRRIAIPPIGHSYCRHIEFDPCWTWPASFAVSRSRSTSRPCPLSVAAVETRFGHRQRGLKGILRRSPCCWSPTATTLYNPVLQILEGSMGRVSEIAAEHASLCAYRHCALVRGIVR